MCVIPALSVGGLLCGPLVGAVAGIVGGLHRIFIGGFTAVECGISTILAGFLAGYIHYRMRPRTPEVVTGIVTSTTVVLFSMGLIWFFCQTGQCGPIACFTGVVTNGAG